MTNLPEVVGHPGLDRKSPAQTVPILKRAPRANMSSVLGIGRRPRFSGQIGAFPRSYTRSLFMMEVADKWPWDRALTRAAYAQTDRGTRSCLWRRLPRLLLLQLVAKLAMSAAVKHRIVRT